MHSLIPILSPRHLCYQNDWLRNERSELDFQQDHIQGDFKLCERLFKFSDEKVTAT